MSIDWFAVECAMNGTPMRLNAEERRMLIRRKPDLEDLELARRACCTDRTILRHKHELSRSRQWRCPVCRQAAWVRNDGIVEPHSNSLLQECWMSLSPTTAVTDWEERTAAVVLWLSRRIRVGDSVSVWAYLSQLDPEERTQLLMASLAAVPDSGDPFAWLTELESVA